MARVSRQTKQKELLASIIEKTKGFFSADTVFAKAQEKDKSIGIATVYRYLKDAVQKGELQSYTCDKRNIYSKEHSHCHFVCEDTGKVIHFTVDNIDFIKKKIPGTITSFSLEVKGKLEK